MAEQEILHGDEAHTLLRDVIAGSTTFRESLDGLVEELKQTFVKPKKLEGKWILDDECLDRFKGLVGFVDALSEKELDTAALNNTAKNICGFKYMRKAALKNAAFTAVGGLLSYIPFVAPVGWFAMFYSWTRFTQYGFGTVFCAEAAKNPEKVLAPLYEAADSLDAVNIDSSFVFDIFCSSRPRFEVVYTALPSGEREAVNSRLYGFLGAGGMPSMDEIQLKDYLAGILENVPENAPEMVKEVPQEITIESSEAPAEPFNQPVNPYKHFWLRSTM